jgi:hypothetical protein
MLHILPSNRFDLPQDLQTTFDMHREFERSTDEWRAHGRHVSVYANLGINFLSELLIGRNTPPVRPKLQPPYHAPGTLSAFRDEGVIGFAFGAAQAAIAEAGALLGVIVGTVPYAFSAMWGTGRGTIMPAYAGYGKQAGLLAASIAGAPFVIGLRIMRDAVPEAISLGTHGALTAAGVFIGMSVGICKASMQAFGIPEQKAS